jgi:hypothetical protein
MTIKMASSSDALLDPVSAHNRNISGTLLFKDDYLPTAEMKVRFYSKDFFGRCTYLGETETNENGVFNFNYKWDHISLPFKNIDIVLEVIEKKRPFANEGLRCFKEIVTVARKVFSLPPYAQKNILGVQYLDYNSISSDLTQFSFPTPSHSPSVSYYMRLLQAFVPESIKAVIVLAFQKILNLYGVQGIYDSFGTAYLKRAATPENLIDALLNQICAVDYKKFGDKVFWEANWDQRDFDETSSLPNVTVTAKKDKTRDLLVLESIDIKFREDIETRTFSKNSPDIAYAIFTALSAFALKGEAEIHLAEGHLMPDIPAKSFFKHIRPDNPIYPLIAPFIDQLNFINWLGSKGIIFGKGSVLEMSSLTPDATAAVIIDHMKKKANWQKDAPKEPLCANHFKAIAYKNYYSLLFNFFKKRLSQYRDEFVENSNLRNQLYLFSESVHRKFSAIPVIINDPNVYTYKEELNLAQFLTWLVCKTTFLHWSAHSRQDLLTDIFSVTLAIRNHGLTEAGEFSPGGNTDLLKASKQLQIARTLLNFKGDTVANNPYHNIDPELRDLILSHKHQFPTFDINEMHMTTQI